MPGHGHYGTRNISPLIREWERALRRRGWVGSSWKLYQVAGRKARKGQRP